MKYPYAGDEPPPAPADRVESPAPRTRLLWLDGIKGLAILWIVVFHFFSTYWNNSVPSPFGRHYFDAYLQQCVPSSAAATVSCILSAIGAATGLLGRQGVHVFIVMSGFGLMYSLAGRGAPANGWAGWYRARVLRLFPLYWLAHIIFLVIPFEYRPEPIDYRFLLSFMGDRVYPIGTIFYYANASWWYVGLILELYLLFPLLYVLLKKAGTGWFLLLCAAETIFSRYFFLYLVTASTDYIVGGFCGCRLWEFAFGMVMGLQYRQNRVWMDKHLFSFATLIMGIAIYTAGLYSYSTVLTYTLTDGLIGTGLFAILTQLAYWSRRIKWIEAAIAYIGVYSYGLYLLHQPYLIYFGIRMRFMSMAEFIIAASIIIAVFALIAAQIEQYVNDLTDRLVHRGRARLAQRAAV